MELIKKFVGYNKIKNIMIHNNGELDDNELGKIIRTFVGENNFKKINDDGMIQLEEGFCLEVIENINKFFIALFKEIDNKYEKQ